MTNLWVVPFNNGNGGAASPTLGAATIEAEEYYPAQWSPDVATGPKGKYYWMFFSSNRANIPPGTSSRGRTIPISQLYLAPILIDETFQVISYPAIYLWNQPTTSVNTTPEWEALDIPLMP